MPGHGRYFFDSYRKIRMGIISVCETIAAGIFGAKRNSVELRVLRGAFYVSGGGDLARKMLKVAKFIMFTLSFSNDSFVTLVGCRLEGVPVGTSDNEGSSESNPTAYIVSKEKE